MKNTKVGNVIIYEEQISCGNEILTCFKRQDGPPLLVAQMQQGKTSVCIYVIDQHLKECENKKINTEVFYLTNISDNVLKTQVTNRILEAGLRQKVQILHHADLNKTKLNPHVHNRLIIIDECHLALDKDCPFHNFLKKCGIKYGESIKTWSNKNNYVLSVSATPYAQIIKDKINDASFEVYNLSISKDYFSLKNLKEKGRIRESKKIIEKNKKTKKLEITPFFRQIMSEFSNFCKSNGGKRAIIRTKGEHANVIKKFIVDEYREMTVDIYDVKNKNISAIDSDISGNHFQPHVLIIKGSLRAGKTLSTTKHIGLWIEPHSSKADTMCQAVGRCLGYEMVEGYNRKFDDNFPIYCNTDEIDDAISFYEDPNKGTPSGNNNKPTKEETKKIDFIILDAQNDEEARLECKQKHNIIVPITISKCSDIAKNDTARDIINRTDRGQYKDEKRKRIFLMDGPNSNFYSSWDELDLQYKHKYLLPMGTTIHITIENEGKLKEGMIFTCQK